MNIPLRTLQLARSKVEAARDSAAFVLKSKRSYIGVLVRAGVQVIIRDLVGSASNQPARVVCCAQVRFVGLSSLLTPSFRVTRLASVL